MVNINSQDELAAFNEELNIRASNDSLLPEPFEQDPFK
jgi:hypothetical protein